MNLYEITKGMNELLNNIPENPTEEEVDLMQQEFLKYDSDFTEKVENTVKYMRNLEAETNAIDFEIERLQKKKSPIVNKINRLKDYIDWAMKATGYDKLNTTIAKLSYRKSTSVLIESEDHIPDEFKTEITSIKISKADIKKALKDWDVPWAKLIEKQSLQIK